MKKLFSVLSKISSAFVIFSGLILASLPLFFHDYLVTYQFRPNSRPLYPLFYGAIIAGGIAIAALGVLGIIFGNGEFKKTGKSRE